MAFEILPEDGGKSVNNTSMYSTDSEAEQRRLMRTATDDVPIPVEFGLDQPREKELWRTITKARRAEDWRDIDKLNICRAIKLQMESEHLDKVIEEDGHYYTDHNGNMKVHPAVTARSGIIEKVNSIFRFLSLTVGADVANTLSRAKRREAPQANIEPKTKRGRRGSGVVSLLAEAG